MQVEARPNDYYSEKGLNETADPSIEIDIYPSIQKSILNITKNEGYISHNMLIRRINTDGGNYFSKLYEIDVEGETSVGYKKTNIFMKHIIPEGNTKDVIDIQISFKNEIFVYTKLKNMYRVLQETAQITRQEKFKLIKIYDESNEDAILLDNLTRKGFKSLHRMDVIPLNVAEQAIKELAKFHALSFVIKHTKRDYLEKEIKPLQVPFQFSQPWKDFVSRMIESSMKYFSNDVQDKMLKFKHVLWEKYPKYVTGNTKSIRCLCHGDFRMNNVLIKEVEDNIEVALIDYQLIYYGSPVTDIMYLLFLSTDREFRNAHLNNLKDLYHGTLTHFLTYFDLDINNVYPRKIFEKDFNDYMDYGLMISLFILPFCFVVDDVPDFSKGTIKDVIMKLDNRYKGRIIEIVEEFMGLGIL